MHHPITTDSRHRLGIAPNLLGRNFDIVTPDAIWLAGISYIPTDEGWLYLAAVNDMGPARSWAGAWTPR